MPVATVRSKPVAARISSTLDGVEHDGVVFRIGEGQVDRRQVGTGGEKALIAGPEHGSVTDGILLGLG